MKEGARDVRCSQDVNNAADVSVPRRGPQTGSAGYPASQKRPQEGDRGQNLPVELPTVFNFSSVEAHSVES